MARIKKQQVKETVTIEEEKKVFKPQTIEEMSIKMQELMANNEILRKDYAIIFAHNDNLKTRNKELEMALKAIMEKYGLKRINI